MRDFLALYVNGRRHEIRGNDAFLSLAEYLRTRLNLTGTKIVCSEGDCGSCSVLVGRPSGGKLEFRAIDSCIQFMFQLDGAHVISIEGLRGDKELTPVQQAMVSEHGSQCGYCTPGFVVAMTGILGANPRPSEQEWRCGLTGNLCRCTGYVSILSAARKAASASAPTLHTDYPPEELLADLLILSSEPFQVSTNSRQVFSPCDLPQAVEYLAAHPLAKVIAGGTDVGVQVNKRTMNPSVFLDLGRLTEIREIRIQNGAAKCGALANWADLELAFRTRVPAFADIIAIFGSPQIRHVGTIGGNLINASPIADSLPFLLVAEAELEIIGPNGNRSININRFYHGYRKTDLQPGEILTSVRIPLPSERSELGLYKVSRRRDLDIASFTAALLLELNGDQISSAKIALGAVAPTVLRAPRTEEFLRGKPFQETVLRSAGELAAAEVSPISDVRGSADFRLQLVRNVFLKFFHERTRVAA